MPVFSERSLVRLRECDERLQMVCQEVIKHFDCVVLCGHRTEEEQTRAYRSGKSKVQWPDSKHNGRPSLAVDIAPYDRPESPVVWNDVPRFRYFAGWMMATAASMGIALRWGGDWDMDTQVRDNGFNDLVHFEIVE